VRYFLLLLFIEVCAFGNALMILDYYMVLDSRGTADIPAVDYQNIYPPAFGLPLIDSVVD
jgi:hypothetical protein